MKTRVLKLLGMLLVLTLMVPALPILAYTAGVFEGEGRGLGGPILVSVTFSEDAITAIEVGDNKETVGIGTMAFSQLPGLIVQHQSLGVDAIAGATITSDGILEAVAHCVTQAGGDAEALKKVVVEKNLSGETRDIQTDVVVVGAGLGGLTAAVAAAEGGAKVVLLEKMSFVGGSSAQSTGGICFAGTDVQAAAGIEDTPDAFFDYKMNAGDGKSDPVQVRMVADKGNEVLNWMIGMEVPIADDVARTIGGTVARCHVTLPNAQEGLILPLEQAALKAGVELMLGTAAVEIITDAQGGARGVTAKNTLGDTLHINAKSVILATGGFGANDDMVRKYFGAADLLYVAAPGNTGEMTEAAIALGADTVDIDIYALTPTAEITKRLLVTSGVIGGGAILVGPEGKRFCDEATSYEGTSLHVLAQGLDYVNLVFDQHVKEVVRKVPDYINQDMVIQADSVAELATKLGLPAEALQNTMDAYNAAVRGEAADPFGRTMFVAECNQAPYYAMKVKAGFFMTPGGLKINENCEVVHTSGHAIEGLYAVGETTGGYRAYGYLGGDSLGHAAVSGHVAGVHAAKRALETK